MKRNDYPGAWHHVMNRGIARRTVFERRADVRQFMACMAREVRKSRIEIHAYCLLTTHFHILARSPSGELSEAMRQIETASSDGSIDPGVEMALSFAGRFASRLIEPNRYWMAVLRYIDVNSVDAGLADSPVEYPYGSAWHYRRNGPRPRWLHRGAVEALFRSTFEPAGYDSSEYERFSLASLDLKGLKWIVERSWRRKSNYRRIGDLISLAPDGVRSWMRRKARLADGNETADAVVAPVIVLDNLEQMRRERPDWSRKDSRKLVDVWTVMASSLLCRLSSLTHVEAGRLTNRAGATVKRDLVRHEDWLVDFELYAEVSAAVVLQSLKSQYEAFGNPVENFRNRGRSVE